MSNEFLDAIGGAPAEGGGFKVNGLTFTGVRINGRLVVISDQLPVKNKNGRAVHWFAMEERDRLTNEIDHTMVMSQKMYDSIMTDGEIEAFRLNPVSGG